MNLFFWWSMRQSEILFAMTGACGLYGGIASNNLNVLQALTTIARDQAWPLTVFSYLEPTGARPDFLPSWVEFRGFQGHKRRFGAQLLGAVVRRPLLCFDHVTLALPVLPLAAAGIVKTVVLAHGSEAWKRVRRTSRWSFRTAALCLANSHCTLRNMRQYLGSFHGVACPLGLPPTMALNSALPSIGREEIILTAADGRCRALGNFYLLLVARLDPHEGQKGHRALIAALPGLHREFPDIQLVFPGPGEYAQNLHELAQQRGVASAVFLPGQVSSATLQRLYRQCYAFVMPSTQEGFGLVYLEAMNYARPCVGCMGQGAEEVIVPGETGFLIQDPQNPQELLAVLRHLLRSPALAQRLGRNGFARLHSHFTAYHYQERLRAQLARIM
jgi:phosphatidyl-myo-inositol dimannoside synthase